MPCNGSQVDPGQAAKAYAADYDPARGYGGSAKKVGFRHASNLP